MTEYDQNFFDQVSSGAISSAERLVPIVKEIVKPGSVLDVGGGNGAWLKVWLENGVTDALCVDGDYVDAQKLLVPKKNFKSHDLTKALNLKRKFDLVMSLEVAEHLDDKFAKLFVKSLADHSDVIFFSAAIPGQSGVHHVNERWMSYWTNLFKAQGYDNFDILRPVIWDFKDVEPWYRQNCMIFATPSAAKRLNLQQRHAPLDIVHPELFTYHLSLRKPESVEVEDEVINPVSFLSQVKAAIKSSPLGPFARTINNAARRYGPGD